MLNVFEAFAGVGTQRMALERLGIRHEVVGIAEIDKFAIKSYMAIHGNTKNYGDISKIDMDDLVDFDLFTYSFPCQDISMAGKQAGFDKNSGTRSSLLWECERIIRSKKPKYLLMENVKALTFKKNIDGYNRWLNLLEELGYTNYSKVLNAKDYGIPQNRERVFCVSILNDKDKDFEFPKPIESTTRLIDVLEENVDEKYYLSNDRVNQLVKIIKNNDIKEKSVYDSSIKNPKSKNIANCITTKDRGIVNYQSSGNVVAEPKIMQTHKYSLSKRNSPSRFRVFGPKGISPTITTCQGGGLQPCIRIKNGTKKDYLDAYSGDGIDLINPTCNNRRGRVQKESIQTLTCKDDKGVVTEDLSIRRLTPLECWRLMGIDDKDFYKAKKVNSDTQLYKQAGNAIVVDVLVAIFDSLFN